uniref:NADH dehydrogenase subunit 6 n=1 Tax=Parazyginella tiani TaxID=2783702 RepID=A0A872PLA8_9HEMI|nr:NADH dehydrogenase subunit 6 [Parazyginella tiani]QOX09874.1 NADH dehydrogenase subunit 6 [Parazyginella tiani]
MKMIIMKLMMLVTSLISILNNPMSMGMMLMIQTTLIILLLNKIMSSSWFAMITFMMMIGGLLIMFMYMSSIASNEKFKLKINLILIMVILITITDEMFIETQIKENESIMINEELNISLMKMYNTKSMFMTIMLVCYLLLTMIAVTKMVKHSKGPLRAIN